MNFVEKRKGISVGYRAWLNVHVMQCIQSYDCLARCNSIEFPWNYPFDRLSCVRVCFDHFKSQYLFYALNSLTTTLVGTRAVQSAFLGISHYLNWCQFTIRFLSIGCCLTFRYIFTFHAHPTTVTNPIKLFSTDVITYMFCVYFHPILHIYYYYLSFLSAGYAQYVYDIGNYITVYGALVLTVTV